MDIRHAYVSNGEGWELEMRITRHPDNFDRKRRPILIVPGYGMNTFIFGYHPTGMSMEESLATDGFEVWSVNLRGQGGSRRNGNASNGFGLRQLSLVDLPAALKYVKDNTEGDSSAVDTIGCSLGGTLVYAYAALGNDNLMGSVVTMGAPLRWDKIHPILRFAFRSPKVARLLRLKGTRTLARYALPVMKKLPFLLSIYLHPEIVDLSHPEELSKTVEDPQPDLNEEICQWVIDRDLIIDGENVFNRLSRFENPILVLLANADGIVPPETALNVLDAVRSPIADNYTAGTEKVQMAHADLFISYYSQQLVFDPLAEWLRNRLND